jgi:hypothetical protein
MRCAHSDLGWSCTLMPLLGACQRELVLSAARTCQRTGVAPKGGCLPVTVEFSTNGCAARWVRACPLRGWFASALVERGGSWYASIVHTLSPGQT